MASANVIDIDALLAPIKGKNPVGKDIRQDTGASSIYYKIKDARAGARTSERQLLAEDDPEKINIIAPEWATVLDAATKILSSQAKDLEVAAWYTEGLLRFHGLPGLRDGFRLITGLVDNFWDDIYPLPDEDGLETRIAPLIGLNGEDGEGTLLVPINKVALTEENSYPPFATWHYEQAFELEKITDPKKKEARIASGAVTMKMIEQAVLETSSGVFTQLKQDLDECIDAFTKLTAALDKRCGKDSPPSSNISNRLKRLKQVIGFLSKDVAENGGTDKAQSAATHTPSTVPASAVMQGNSAIPTANGATMNRDDAHRTLLQVAKFFRETEPHSPVPFMLEQAVRWGNLSLPELLSELITDERARNDYCKMTGIPVDDKKRKKNIE